MEGVHSVAFSPDGKTIASGTEYNNQLGEVWLWNAATGKYKAGKRGFYGAVNFAFSPDGQTLATQTKMGQQVMLWDAVTGVVKFTFPWHSSYFSSFAFSPDGQTLATGTGDGFIFLWELTPDMLQPSVRTSAILPPLPAYPPQIRLIYFFPGDHTLQPNIDTELETLIKQTQDFYAEQMENHGFGRKTFHLETDSNGKAVVHHVQGSSPAEDYISRSISIVRELEDLLDLIDHIYLVVLDPSIQGCLGRLCGLTLSYGSGVSGGAFQMSNNGRLAVVYASGDCAGVGTTAHELGHTFGLAHDYRDKDYVMNHGPETPRFSYAAAEWLNVHPFLNPGQPNSENHTTIEVLSPRSSRLQFQIADTDGLHQAQLVLNNVTNNTCGGTDSLHHFQALNGTSSITLEFASTEVSTEAEIRVIDLHGNISWRDLWIEPDSIVQIQEDTGIQQYEREMVRLIYFRPSDRLHRQGIDTELDTLIRGSQYFFAEQMQNYGRKTFAFETDATGYAKVHHVTGKFTDTYYHSDTYDKVVKEVAEQFDTSRDVFLIAIDVSSEFINDEGTCGIGGGGWQSHDNELWRRDFGGTAVIPASGVCINPSITAHELGHVFGLEHDFRDDAYLMAYGTQERLSHCATEWLDAHRFFNNDPTSFNDAATMDMHASNTSTPGNLSLRFELTDTDGLHEAQLIVPAAATDPAQGTKLHSCKSLNGKNQTVAFLTTDATVPSDSEVTLQVVDGTGNITRQTFSLKGGDITSNRSPVAVGTIPDQTLTLGGSATTLSISSYFSDPDGDVLSYRATSNNTSVGTVSVSGTRITIAPRGVGGATVTVTASDGKLSVVQHLSVHVSDTPVVTNPTDNFDDPFEGTALPNPNWQWQNEPANWDVGETRENFLHIESETNRNLWVSDASHFLYQETDADTFDVETHFFARWDTSSGVNGLVVKSPADNNWVTLKFWSRDAGAKGQIQYQTRGRESGNGLTGNAGFTPTFGNTELFFRLRKQGDTYTGWYKTHEADPWIEIGVTNFPLTPPLQLGVYAGVAAGTGTLTVDYEYFRSTVDTGVLASPVLHVAAMAAPSETTLLPNYPNPFNPETWIPYQLSSPSDVTVHIYAVNGNLVRRLSLGHQTAGVYRSRSRAAYWDGKNELGELVASGIYFYTLTAGDFTATRRMLIRK